MRRATDLLAAAALVGALAGCGRVTVEPQHARILLNADSPRPTIDVIDVPPALLQSLEAVADDGWPRILKIAAGADQQAILGQYAIVDGRVRFTPMAPLRRGRPYQVSFTPAGFEPLTTTVMLPAADVTPTTIVTELFPTATVLPSNQQRFYIQFSAPMDPRGARDFVRLVDENGADVNAFAPAEPSSWNEDRTRYTLVLDQDLHALVEGRAYTLMLDSAWRDGNGLPLKQPYRRTFTTGAAVTAAIDPKAWKLDLPPSNTIRPLVIIFPTPLDHERLANALTVQSATAKRSLTGHASSGAGEMTWTFVPDEPWQAGEYAIDVGEIEDLGGNGSPPKTSVPFTIR